MSTLSHRLALLGLPIAGAMCRPAFVAALAIVVPVSCQAAGSQSFQTRPTFAAVVKAGIPTPNIQLPSAPQINPAQFFRGCGRGRVRDSQTNLCRGPGDIDR
jgi:hypothetical protein